MRKARILVAGGGIGGLTAACALTRHGFEVSIYEQDPEPREFGAGITISPNSSRVMAELGLRRDMEEIASSPTHRAMRLYNLAATGERYIWPAFLDDPPW